MLMLCARLTFPLITERAAGRFTNAAKHDGCSPISGNRRALSGHSSCKWERKTGLII
jgi:hypothetical protein